MFEIQGKYTKATIINRVIPIHNMKSSKDERPWKKKKDGSKQTEEINID